MDVFCDEVEWAMRLGMVMVAAGMVAGAVWQGGLIAAENEAPASEPATASQPTSQPATTAAATQTHNPYFMVYMGTKEGTDGRLVLLWQASTVSVELHDTLKKSDTAYFKLHQGATQRGAVIFLDADGAAVSENHVYVIHSGEILTLRHMAVSGGEIAITASDAEAEP